MTNFSSLLGLETNIGGNERIISVIAGSALLFYTLRGKKSPPLLATATLLLLRGSTGYSPIYQSIKVNTAHPPSPVAIKTGLTVNLSRKEVYVFWRDFQNLPLFMKHLQEVKVLDQEHSQWKAKIPGGSIGWVSRITSDVEDERISWESVPDSDVQHQGEVRFRDAGKFGTEVQLDFSYKAPVGEIGSGVTKFLNPLLEELVKEEVKNFRRYIETGELPTIEGQPSGKSKLGE